MAITVHNVAHRLTYVKLGEKQWSAYDISSAALKPPRPQFAFSGRHQVLKGAVNGLDAYEVVSRSGARTQIVPALNGLALLHEEPSGLRVEYSNIVLGEPPDEVFTPAPGENVRRINAEFR